MKGIRVIRDTNQMSCPRDVHPSIEGTAIVSPASVDIAKTASNRAAKTGNNDFLLTPGPLTTSLGVKEAMLRDWGSRDPAFIELNADIRRRLTAIAGGGSHKDTRRRSV